MHSIQYGTSRKSINCLTNQSTDLNENRMINKTFSQLPNFILHELEKGFLKPIDVCLYFALKFHAGSKQVCWATIPTLARECNKCTSTIDSSISRLTKRGHIKRKQKTLNGVAHTTLLTYVDINGVTIGKPAGARNHQTNDGILSAVPFIKLGGDAQQTVCKHPDY